jgi:hypothetical protein
MELPAIKNDSSVILSAGGCGLSQSIGSVTRYRSNNIKTPVIAATIAAIAATIVQNRIWL